MSEVAEPNLLWIWYNILPTWVNAIPSSYPKVVALTCCFIKKIEKKNKGGGGFLGKICKARHITDMPVNGNKMTVGWVMFSLLLIFPKNTNSGFFLEKTQTKMYHYYTCEWEQDGGGVGLRTLISLNGTLNSIFIWIWTTFICFGLNKTTKPNLGYGQLQIWENCCTFTVLLSRRN